MKPRWLKIQEPRVVHVIQCAIYLVTLAVGIIALAAPPTSIEGAIGATLTTIWAGFFIFGGTLGAITVLPGAWLWERAAVIACGTGVLMYASIILTLHATEGGNRLPQAGMVIVVLLSFVKRGASIRRYSYDPEK